MDLTEAALAGGRLQVIGLIQDASNATYYATCDDLPCVYKPISGEAPLWDFPDGTLAGRERACWLVARAAGLDCVPVTVLRDGPLGRGAVQQWVGPLPDDDGGLETDPVVRIFAPQELPAGWCPVLRAESYDGKPLIVAHPDSEQLWRIAVLDLLANNADRKGGHLIREGEKVFGIDHGLTFHHLPKLRTVLWGFAERPLPDTLLDSLKLLTESLKGELGEELSTLLTEREITALRRRTRTLLSERALPDPSVSRPALPWPVL